MKILFASIFNLNRLGGVPTYVRDLNAAFTSLGDVTAVASLADLDNLVWFMKVETPNKVEADAGRAVTPRMYQAGKLFLFFDLLLRIPFTNVVFFQDIMAFNVGYPLCRLFRKKYLLTIHSLFADELIAEKVVEPDSVLAKYILSHERKACEKCKIIIAVTKQVQERVASYGGQAVLMKNFVNLDRFAIQPETSTSEGITIFCPARLTPIKGITYAVSMLQYLPEKYHLIVAGDGSERANLEAQITKEKLTDRVTLLGSISGEEMVKHYLAADVVVMPSIKEGIKEEGSPMAAFEAMAASRPLVATLTGGFPVIVRDGENGYLVPERNPEELAKAVEKAYAKRNDLGQNGRQYVEKECSHLTRAREIIHLLK